MRSVTNDGDFGRDMRSRYISPQRQPAQHLFVLLVERQGGIVIAVDNELQGTTAEIQRQFKSLEPKDPGRP